ncbi:MAG TPA: hypothetical protein VMT15_06735 [Bryobacteraceae bacterium]|nr:hypothetical protein [Bryobacteraceae bacterium]
MRTFVAARHEYGAVRPALDSDVSWRLQRNPRAKGPSQAKENCGKILPLVHQH